MRDRFPSRAPPTLIPSSYERRTVDPLHLFIALLHVGDIFFLSFFYSFRSCRSNDNIYYLLGDLRYVINESYLKRDCEDDGMSIISKRDNLLIKFFRTRFPNCSDSRVPTHNFHVRVRKFVITLIIPSFVKLLHDPFLASIDRNTIFIYPKKCYTKYNWIRMKTRSVYREGETLEEETRCRRGAIIMAGLGVVYKQLETRLGAEAGLIRCRWQSGGEGRRRSVSSRAPPRGGGSDVHGPINFEILTTLQHPAVCRLLPADNGCAIRLLIRPLDPRPPPDRENWTLD